MCSQRGEARLGPGRYRKFEFDPPGLTVRLHTLADELAADFHQEARNTEGAQAGGAQIDSVLLGDGGEIEALTPPGWKARRLAASTPMSRQLPDPHG